MKIDKKQWKWTREPKAFSIENDRIEIITCIFRETCATVPMERSAVPL